jgi:4-amino-4-deoxy-L-arabinose transferase-like glycosyltransferase
MNAWLSGRRPAWAGLGLIMVVAGILRFWEIGSDFHFMGDEGTQSLVEWRLIHGHLPLLGPSLSIGTMHLGPLFYYLEAIPLWLSGGSPVGTTVLVGIFGMAAIAMLFLYLRPAVGDWPALAGAATMATSFLMVEYSRRPWNPTPTPFFTLLLLYAMVRWARGGREWVIGAALALAVTLELQPVNVYLAVLFVSFVIVVRPAVPRAPHIVVAVALFVLVFLPLIIYDATHHLANTRAWLNALVGGKSTAPPRSASSVRLIFNLFNRAFEPRIVVVSATIALVLCGAAAVFLIERWREPGGSESATTRVRTWLIANAEVTLPVGLLLIALVGFEVYRKAVYEQYLVCLFVVPFIFVSVLVWILGRYRAGRVIGFVAVTGLVIAGIRDSIVYVFVSPSATVADMAVTRADLQQDTTYAEVTRVDGLIERLEHGPIRLGVKATDNTAAGFSYVLRVVDGRTVAPPSAHPSVWLVQPASLPAKERPQCYATVRVVGSVRVMRQRPGCTP